MHCGTLPNGECNEPNGLGTAVACGGTTCQGNFHIYAFEVDRTGSTEYLRWYLDGVMFQQHSSAEFTATTWNQIAHQPIFILLDLAIGGSFPSGVYGSTTPLSTTTSGGVYTIDYVAVYNK